MACKCVNDEPLSENWSRLLVKHTLRLHTQLPKLTIAAAFKSTSVGVGVEYKGKSLRLAGRPYSNRDLPAKPLGCPFLFCLCDCPCRGELLSLLLQTERERENEILGVSMDRVAYIVPGFRRVVHLPP